MARILAVLLALGAVYYLYRHSAGTASQAPDASSTASPDASSTGPISRSRRVARESEQRNAAAESARRDAEAPSGTVSENMTPDQVRALLGPPSEVRSETMDNGGAREIWTYTSVGKTVVFENGVAVSVR
jgi:hypothetical protein